ncbi:MAG: Gfo/Idh/MocA family oxidoreductase [Mobilicoccus sp.]|nr:Gfo/Idh/MocA family oxidoreductase [Mobilicoccus sp.]
MTVLRVGLAAFGVISRSLHAPAIAGTPGLELAAVATSRSTEVAPQVPGVRLHDSPVRLLADDEVDVVVITTPNDTHVPLALAAIEAGKHVILEKPVALNADEGERLLAAAEQAQAEGLVVSAFHNRRWDGDLATLRRVLDEGLVGRPVTLESRWDRFRPIVQQRWRESGAPGGGVWADLGTHLVDQALVLFGEPEWVWGDLRATRDGALIDDEAHVVLGYGDLRVSIVVSSLSGLATPRFVLRGTRGSVLIDGDVAELPRGVGDEAGTEAVRAVFADADGPRDIRREPSRPAAFYAAFRDAVLGGGEVPVPISDAVAGLRILDAARRSSEEGQRIDVARAVVGGAE